MYDTIRNLLFIFLITFTILGIVLSPLVINKPRKVKTEFDVAVVVSVSLFLLIVYFYVWLGG